MHILPSLSEDKEARKSMDDNDQPSSLTQNAVASFSCEICSKSFPNEDALFQHHLVKHQIPDEEKRSETVEDDSPQVIDEESVSWSIQCPICLMKFPDESQLAAHRSNVIFQPRNAEAIFRCEVCGEKSFHNQRALQQHMKFCSITANHNRKNDFNDTNGSS